MKTRIDELIEENIDIIFLHNLKNSYDNGYVDALYDVNYDLKKIDQSYLTPVEALKVCPDWIQAIAMDADGMWYGYEKEPFWEKNMWELKSKTHVPIYIKIKYDGEPEDSLVTREMFE